MERRGGREVPKERRSEEIEQRLATAFADIENWQRSSVLSSEEIRRIVYFLNDLDWSTSSKTHKYIEEVLSSLTRRLEEESVETTPFTAATEANKKLKVPIKFPRLFVDDNTAGYYNYFTGNIVFRLGRKGIFSNPPSPVTALLALATEGSSQIYSSLHHEFIHSQQFDPPTRELGKFVANRFVDVMNAVVLPLPYLGKLTPLYSALYIAGRIAYTIHSDPHQLLLKEVQAYIGMQRFTGDPFTYKSAEDLLELFRKGAGPLQGYRDIIKWWSAYEDVRRLYALGATDQFIGGLVKKARWNQQAKRYDALDKAINYIMEREGYTESDLDNLCSLQELERQRFILRTRIIAQEELSKIYVQHKKSEELADEDSEE